MRNKIITLLILLLYTTQIVAQTKYTTSIKTVQELRDRLQKAPYVYGIPTSISFENKDWRKNFKEITYDKKIKQKLLTIFDQKKYFEYYIAKRVEEFKDLMKNETFSDDELKSYLNGQNRNKQYDSIKQNIILYEKYKDSIVMDRIKLYKKDQKSEDYYPDGGDIKMVSYAHYPEAYLVTKKWWIRAGKNTNYGDMLFESLLEYNDPEAQNLLTKKIDEFVKSNGKSERPVAIHSLLSTRNSYSLNQLFRLLVVTIDNPGFPGENATPFNCDMINSIISILEYDGGYKFTDLPSEKKDEKKRSVNCENQFENLLLAKEFAKDYSLKLDKEQEYWMKNMPFF